MHINPQTFDLLFRQSGLTQRELASRARVSAKTLTRIRQGVNPNRATVKGIAQALNTTPEVLAGPPTDPAAQQAENTMKAAGYRRLNTYIPGERALQYGLIEAKYGISAGSLVNLAPLLFAILAEMSLADRSKRLAALEEAIAACSRGTPDHLNGVWRGKSELEAAVDVEAESIARADIRGDQLDDAELPDGGDLFAGFLASLGSQLGKDVVDNLSGDTDWLSYDIFPSYLANLAGGDRRAKFALNRGYVHLREIPLELTGDDRTSERVAWLAAKVPEPDWQKNEEDFGSLASLLAPIIPALQDSSQ